MKTIELPKRITVYYLCGIGSAWLGMMALVPSHALTGNWWACAGFFLMLLAVVIAVFANRLTILEAEYAASKSAIDSDYRHAMMYLERARNARAVYVETVPGKKEMFFAIADVLPECSAELQADGDPNIQACAEEWRRAQTN